MVQGGPRFGPKSRKGSKARLVSAQSDPLMPPPSAVVPERGTGIYCGEEAGDEVARGALTARILVME